MPVKMSAMTGHLRLSTRRIGWSLLVAGGPATGWPCGAKVRPAALPRYYRNCTCAPWIPRHTRGVRYQQVCPVSLASEVIAERWTPLILREIVLFGARRFGDIQRGTGRISQSLLVQRLRTLEEARVIERRPNTH